VLTFSVVRAFFSRSSSDESGAAALAAASAAFVAFDAFRWSNLRVLFAMVLMVLLSSFVCECSTRAKKIGARWAYTQGLHVHTDLFRS